MTTEAILAQLKDWCTDWNGDDLHDDTTTRSEINCKDIRRLATLIEHQASLLDEARVLAEAVGSISDIDCEWIGIFELRDRARNTLSKLAEQK